MSRVIHFEYRASDPERASASTKKCLAGRLRNGRAMEYWMVTLGRRERRDQRRAHEKHGRKDNHNTIGVDSVDAAVQTVKKAGGKLVMRRRRSQLSDTSRTLPHEGNLFGVMQADKNAE